MSETVPEILARLSSGDASVSARLLPVLYDELRKLAGSWFQHLPPGQTLQPTALVNEALLRLLGTEPVPSMDRTHFMALAAKAMRQVLIDHARKKGAQKRGGGNWARITLGDTPARVASPIELLAVDEALNRLAKLSERQASIVELRVFGGLTIEETAKALGIGASTVKSQWLIARTWLKRELSE